MLEIYENEGLRRFLEELENIKQSDPKEIVLPKVKYEPKGLFSRLFEKNTLNLADNKEEIFENISIDGCISIEIFIEKLKYIFDYIYKEAYSIVKKYAKYTKCKENIFPFISLKYESNYFSIGYFPNRHGKSYQEKCYKEKNYSYANSELEIDIRQFPKLVEGDYECYEYLKEDLFSFFPYLKLYISLFSKINRKKSFDIVKNNYSSYESRDKYTNFKINFDNVNDVFRKEFPIFQLEISNLAMIEYVLREKINCMSYSDNAQILSNLKKEERKLLYSCYLSNGLDIIKLLNNFNFEE